MINRLLLEEDYKRISKTNLEQIRKLISYYQIISEDENKENNNLKINVSFDKDKMHDFFYGKNILYSDIINTEVILFLLKKDQYFIYTQNYFYENWNEEKLII